MTTGNISLGLIKPKSPTNVGSVMRAAGCYGVNSVFYTGSRYDRANKFCTDTRPAESSIPLNCVDNLLDHVQAGMKVVCVELVLGATPLPGYRHPQQVMYIFGPEDGTLSQELIDRADDVVYIPTNGCMNLAATVNVVLYDRLSKSDLGFAGDDWIRQSRDTNNRVKRSKQKQTD